MYALRTICIAKIFRKIPCVKRQEINLIKIIYYAYQLLCYLLYVVNVRITNDLDSEHFP